MRPVKQSDIFETVLNKTLNFLSYRGRSTQEVVNRLTFYTKSSEIRDKVISYLQENKLLDDLRFATDWVHYRHTRYSQLQLKSELRKKGIGQSIIEKVMPQSSEDKKLIETIILKKTQLGPSLKDQQPKLTRYLLSKGFLHQDISEVFYELHQRMLN